MKFDASFTLDFCYQSQHSNEVIAFDVYFNWRFEGNEPTSELMLKAEGCVVLHEDAFDFVPIFTLRHARNHDVAIILDRGQRARRFPLVSSGPGGNWHWETFRFPAKTNPHLLNWLRRRKHFDVTEWDHEFREFIWDRRGSIQRRHLRTFAHQRVADYAREGGVE